MSTPLNPSNRFQHGPGRPGWAQSSRSAVGRCTVSACAAASRDYGLRGGRKVRAVTASTTPTPTRRAVGSTPPSCGRCCRSPHHLSQDHRPARVPDADPADRRRLPLGGRMRSTPTSTARAASSSPPPAQAPPALCARLIVERRPGFRCLFGSASHRLAIRLQATPPVTECLVTPSSSVASPSSGPRTRLDRSLR